MATKKKPAGTVKNIKVTDIKAAKYNPRTMDDKGATALDNSMSSFQNIAGITWNQQTKSLVTGHQRWSRLNANKAKIELVLLEKDDKNSVAWYQIFRNGKYTTFDLRVVDWTLEQEKMANLTANNHNVGGKFDLKKLPIVMKDINFRKDKFRLKDLKIDFDLDNTHGPQHPGHNSGPDDEEIQGSADTYEQKIKKDLKPKDARIIITCNPDDAEEIKLFIQGKLLETSLRVNTIKLEEFKPS